MPSTPVLGTSTSSPAMTLVSPDAGDAVADLDHLAHVDLGGRRL